MKDKGINEEEVRLNKTALKHLENLARLGVVHEEFYAGHMARIVWISEDKTVIAVKCPRKHLGKVVKNRKIYDKNVVFSSESEV